MGHSIQEILKKINRRLSYTDCVSICLSCVIVSIFCLYLYLEKQATILPVTYHEAASTTSYVSNTSLPFGSITGKTYTFSWCQRSDVILVKNRIYFKDEIEAQASGRALSLFCKK